MAANSQEFPLSHLKNRKNKTLEDIFLPISLDVKNSFNDEQWAQTTIFTSSNDLGVALNGGRKGSRFAPHAITHVLKKMTRTLNYSSKIPLIESWANNQNHDTKEDFSHFEALQKQSEEMITNSIKQIRGTDQKQKIFSTSPQQIIHIGGGHDHVAPLLKSLEQLGIENFLSLNIDAHCDTRQDKIKHSGTPFRQFSDSSSSQIYLYQYGIHDYSNDSETMAPLSSPNHQMIIKKQSQIIDETSYFTHFKPEILFQGIIQQKKKWQKQSAKTAILFSLDSDGIDSTLMEGVSATNAYGLPGHHIEQLLSWFQTEFADFNRVYGIYEYNPIFDNLSQKGAKFLAHLIYRIILNHP